MSQTITLVATPGWFVDPVTGNRMRWWDGTSWTDHYADYNQPSPERSLSAGRPFVARSRRELRTQVGPLTYGELGDEMRPPGRGRRARAPYAVPAAAGNFR